MLALTFVSSHFVVFAATLAAAAVGTPLAMKLALSIGLVDQPAPHKFHQEVTPYLGGLAIVAAVMVTLVVGIVGRPASRVQLIGVAIGAAAVAAIGLADDWAILRPAPRLIVQVFSALALWAGGIRVAPSGFVPLDLGLTILAVLAVTNAVNLLDNMDGLSSGTVAIASLFFFVASRWQGQEMTPLMALMLAGACLGFLPYNFNPARIFLGDIGTMFIGFLVATLAIKLKLVGYPVVTRVTVPTLIIAVPLLDMTLVVFSRWRGGRPVFHGSTDHSSHRLVAWGLSVRGAAGLTYAASIATGSIALLLLSARSAWVTWGVLAVCAFAGVTLIWLFDRHPTADRSRVSGQKHSASRMAEGTVLPSAELVLSEAGPPEVARHAQ
jgi:UDP-GlcNAc:undecaprenyl-phosphate GlcNAc-1-phosphate transferase